MFEWNYRGNKFGAPFDESVTEDAQQRRSTSRTSQFCSLNTLLERLLGNTSVPVRTVFLSTSESLCPQSVGDKTVCGIAIGLVPPDNTVGGASSKVLHR